MSQSLKCKKPNTNPSSLQSRPIVSMLAATRKPFKGKILNEIVQWL